MSRLAIVLTALSLSLLSLAPTAAAAPACTEEAPDLGAGWYVVVRGQDLQVWHEDNGVPGLQTTQCVTADGVLHDRDFRNVNLYVGPPEMPCIPVFRPCPF